MLGPGSQVAGYTIIGSLGRGGMGSVWAAEHTILRRTAALKTLLPELAGDADFRDRFVAESQMISALDHPSIIPIYDAGEADGVVYIAMRHVGGGDLATLIDQGPIEPERVVSILQQVAGALDAAHAHGLVHRDVKPANVLLEPSEGRAYLTDFGIAKRTGTRGLTRTGFFVGTLDYAAPEQIRGDPVGPSADVYAFGCLLFETLTGRKPFERETDVAVMNAQLNDAPPSVTGLRGDLPSTLEPVVARGLAKENAERFGSCRELIEGVRAALGGKVFEAPKRARAQAGVRNLPAEPTPLIGRRAEIAAVLELARRPGVRLITLTGPGGTGKTRLSVAAASELAGDVQTAAFVDLASTTEADLVGTAIARALAVEESPELSLVEALTRALGPGPALLVLDNFEQVLPAATLVNELLGGVAGLKVLVTSQAPLRLREEHEFPVPALEPASAVELFVDRVQAVKPSFELSDGNRGSVESICARLDGLPLALELAAARVKLLSPQAILDRLGQRLDLLTGGAVDLPERQRTLRGAIEWSFNLLEPSEQELLSRLGVFSGGCSLEIADAVCSNGANTALDGLASLVDKSLVRQWDDGEGEPRFGLLESIREYALERLQAKGELERFRRRHAERYLELVEAAEPELTRANQAVWLARLDEEADNVRAAVVWASAAGDGELALRLAGALVRFWSTRGLMGEGRRLLRDAFAAGGAAAPATLAKAYFAAGYAALGEGDFAEAKQAFEQSLASTGGDQAAALAQLAWLSMASGGADASDLAERSLALASMSGDGLTESGALGTLAELAAAAGDYDAAIRLLERGLALRRALGDTRLVANSLLMLGRMELLRGELDRATMLLEESLVLARAVKDTWSSSVALANLGRVRLCQSDAAGARSLFEEGLGVVLERNDRRVTAELLQGLAAVVALEGRPADAASVLGAAEAIRESTGGTPSPAETMIATRFLASLRESLGEEGFDAQVMTGRTLGIDAALVLASPAAP